MRSELHAVCCCGCVLVVLFAEEGAAEQVLGRRSPALVLVFAEGVRGRSVLLLFGPRSRSQLLVLLKGRRKRRCCVLLLEVLCCCVLC